VEVNAAIIEIVGKVAFDNNIVAVKINIDTPATIVMASGMVYVVVSDDNTLLSVGDVDAANIIHDVETDVVNVILFNDHANLGILSPDIDTVPDHIGNIVVGNDCAWISVIVDSVFVMDDSATVTENVVVDSGTRAGTKGNTISTEIFNETSGDNAVLAVID
jgi:hypothetical protein